MKDCIMEAFVPDTKSSEQGPLEFSSVRQELLYSRIVYNFIFVQVLLYFEKVKKSNTSNVEIHC